METASESLLNQSSSSSFQKNIFGQVNQQSGFAAQGAPSGFGSNPSPGASVFGPGAFGGNTAGNPESPSVFGGAGTSSVFGGAPATSSVFGAPAASPASPGTTNYDRSIYTPIEELSESDLEQFRAPTFTLSKLPLVPPPKELC